MQNKIIKNDDIPHTKRNTIITIISLSAVLIGFTFSLIGTWRSSQEAEMKSQEVARLASTAKEIAAKNTISIESERYLLDGVELANRGRLTDAIAAYNKTINLNPQSANAYQLLGYALFRRSQEKPGVHPNDARDSIVALEKAIQIDANHVWAHYNLALSYWAAGKKSQAIDTLRRLIELKPSMRGVVAGDLQFKKFRESPDFMKLINPS